VKRRQNREIMVFSISFLDVIASALGAILILFIVQYKKTVNARVEVTRSEQRHLQCTEVLEWVYAMDHQVVTNEVVVSNRSTDTVQNTPYDKEGTATKPNSPNNNVVLPTMRKEPPMKKIPALMVRPAMRRTRPLPMPVMSAQEHPSMKATESAPGDMSAPVPRDTEHSRDMSPEAAMVARSSAMAKTMGVRKTQEQNTAQPVMGVARETRPGALKLPPKPKRKALATCITSRDHVIVAFYDYDEPDGDTIMVTFNGRHATKLVLEKAPTKRFRFALTQGKYNIISIKNLSNGFYPINTANVSISGCGKARWKMKSVGVTRVIYIYRK